MHGRSTSVQIETGDSLKMYRPVTLLYNQQMSFSCSSKKENVCRNEFFFFFLCKQGEPQTLAQGPPLAHKVLVF